MKVKIKKGDSYIEVDSEFPDEKIDYALMNEDDLGDTLELDLNKLSGEKDE